jgi:hypothetical protein
MSYKELFGEFWQQVKESVEEERFAKLTMAKTIGKPNLRNVFLRPIYAEDGFRVVVKLRYRSRDTEDKEDEMSLEEALEVVKKYLQTPFLSVLLFTTTKDVTFKINKKGAGSIVENVPTFSYVREADTGSD